MNLKTFVVIVLSIAISCGNSSSDIVSQSNTTLSETKNVVVAEDPIVGADRWEEVLQAVQGKRVGCVVNHTSTSGAAHLVDRLIASDVEVVKVFAPEHGFRGLASDGEHVADQIDLKTGVSIVSLYGKNKRPNAQMLEGLDLIIFDIQDVGTRFYTYISTMHYVMDAGAEYGVPVLILDRPNPNGHYVDGPILDLAYQSFIGMHPIPVVHGLTVGELALMINGEGWLEEGRKADLSVLQVESYRVGEEYILPIKPSPNLPNQASIYLYPTLCFFEGTVASVGRGTDFPFQVIGHPNQGQKSFEFTPKARPGAAYAKLKDKKCFGVDLSERGTIAHDSIAWSYLAAFAKTCDTKPFIDRNEHFDRCAGSDRARNAFMSGELHRFRESYQKELSDYLDQRKPYLLYPRI